VKFPGGFETTFRQITPLVLLGVLFVVVFEPWVPGGAWVRAQFGDAALLRACVAVLVCYVLILWGESLRLHTMLTGVLQAFRQFDRDGGSAAAPAAAARNPKARLEAARLLIAALGSPDASIRATSRHNLARLVGEDLGDDPAAWSAWLRRHEQPPPS
jgi:hypothetical protein